MFVMITETVLSSCHVLDRSSVTSSRFYDGLSVPLCVCCVDDNLYVGQEYGDIKIFTWSKAEQ